MLIRFKSLLVSLFFILIYLNGCFDEPKDPVFPSWDVELNLPLINKTITLAEIIDSSNNPSVGIFDSLLLSNGTLLIRDSIYFIYLENLEAATHLQDSINIPSPIIPSAFQISGANGSGSGSMVYNPDPEYHIDTAEFKSGAIKLKLINNESISVDYELIFPGFKHKASQEIMRAAGTLAGTEILDIEIPLVDYIYIELPVLFGLNDVINFRYQGAEGFFIVGRGSSQGSVNVSFLSQVSNDEIILSRMVGRIGRIEFDPVFNTVETYLGEDIRNFSSHVDFKNVYIDVSTLIFGEIKNVNVILDSASVTGIYYPNGIRTEFPLLFEGNHVYQYEFIAGEQATELFSQDNSNVKDFMLELPDSVTVSTKFIFDKSTASPDSLQVISDRDSAKFVVNLVAPLSVSAKDAEYSDTLDLYDHDEFKLDSKQGLFSEKDSSDISNANSATLTIEIENHIALGMIASIVFVDENYNILFRLRNMNGTNFLDVPPADVSNDGIPTNAALETLTVQLDEDEIGYLAQAKYFLVSLAISSTGSTSTTFGPYVRVRAKDFLKYRIYGTVNYRVDLEGD